MSWKLYKEGQGKWIRNSVAIVLGSLSYWAAYSFHGYLLSPTQGALETSWLDTMLKVKSWPFDYRLALAGPLLVVLLYFAYRQYNHPKWADFLIDTENELKNRVTWPSKREEINASIVVVVTVFLIGSYTLLVDMVLGFLRERVY